MTFITINEIIDMAIMTFAVGYIFAGAFQRVAHQKKEYDPIAHYQQLRLGIDWEAMKFSMLVTAPALILHELGHKFVAIAFGLAAEFHAAYFWLMFGVALKVMGSPFLFFVPAFVSHGGGTAAQGVAIAFAGPGVNGLLWLLSWAAVRQKRVPHRWLPAVILTGKINMFLFIFNMLPIPGFDGFHVYYSLWQALF